MTTDAQTWVVMEGKAGMTPFMAWCRWTGGPRFDDMVLTATDGMSDAPEIEVAAIRLERFLFMVEDGPAWVPVETDGHLRAFVDSQVPIVATPELIERVKAEMDPREMVIRALSAVGQQAVLDIVIDQSPEDIPLAAPPEL